MDIDSTIEDLEAQAYFASQQDKTANGFSLIVEVELQHNNQHSKGLSMALVGLDFVAGFQNTRGRQTTSWLLIPNQAIRNISVLQGSLDKAMVELSAAMFLDSKLRNANASIQQIDAAQILHGKLLSVFGNQLVLKANVLRLVPLESIQWLAVDSLGTASRS